MSVTAAPLAPTFARQSAAAVVMDSTNMTADPTPVQARFPDIDWHRAADIIGKPRLTETQCSDRKHRFRERRPQ